MKESRRNRQWHIHDEQMLVMEFSEFNAQMTFDSTNKQQQQPNRSNNVAVNVLLLRGLDLFQEYVYFNALQHHFDVAFESK